MTPRKYFRHEFETTEGWQTCATCGYPEGSEMHMTKNNKADAFSPSAGLLAKLGSIAVHADEMLSPEGHHFDRLALKQLIDDSEVQAWLKEMDRLAMIPKKR